jgi:hypothetical protein
LFVVAAEALLAHGLSLRAQAMQRALQQLEAPARARVDAVDVYGRSWRDIARVVCGVMDETQCDLLHLCADAEHARLLREQPPLLDVTSVAQVRQVAERGWRVVLRSDATRRAAGEVLDILAAETLAWRVVRADDVRDDGVRRQLHRQYALMAPWREAASDAWRLEPDVAASRLDAGADWRTGWPPLPAV